MKVQTILEEVEWRSIPGWPKYEASSDGRVRNARTHYELKLDPHQGKSGVYLRAQLRTSKKPSKKVNRRVNRLVALAFLPNPERKEEVDHLNHNTLDNRVENLEWVTSLENKRRYWKYLEQKRREALENQQKDRDEYKEDHSEWREEDPERYPF